MKTGNKLLVLLAVAAVIAASAVAVASGADAQAPAATTITLKESQKGQRFTFTDVAPKTSTKGEPHASLGDSFTFSIPLLRDGKRVGTSYNHCVVTRAGRLSHAGTLCDAVDVLPGGSLFAQAVTRRSERIQAVVTGGTGVYAGARGTVTSSHGTDVITLLP